MSRMKKFLTKPLAGTTLIVLALVIGAGIVYGATTVGLFNIGPNVSSSQITVSYTGGCQSITHSGAGSLLIPTNTATEWNDFVAHAPGISVGSCCAGDSGQSCNGPSNACGQYTAGTYSCAGVCSVTTAPGYSGGSSLYGQACTSAANACGQTQGGTYVCGNTCSAGAPGYSDGSILYGQACTLTSGTNSCGQTQQCGSTYNCSDACSGTCSPPANAYNYTFGSTITSSCYANNTFPYQSISSCNSSNVGGYQVTGTTGSGCAGSGKGLEFFYHVCNQSCQ